MKITALLIFITLVYFLNASLGAEVKRIDLRGETTDKLITKVLRLPNLEHLAITNAKKLNNPKIKSENLKILEFAALDITSEVVEYALEHCPSLEKLTIEACPNVKNLFIKGKKLVSLTLAGRAITDLSVMQACEYCPRLEELNLRMCNTLREPWISGENLKKISLFGCGNIRQAIFANVRKNCPKLEKIEVYPERSFMSVDEID